MFATLQSVLWIIIYTCRKKEEPVPTPPPPPPEPITPLVVLTPPKPRENLELLRHLKRGANFVAGAAGNLDHATSSGATVDITLEIHWFDFEKQFAVRLISTAAVQRILCTNALCFQLCWVFFTFVLQTLSTCTPRMYDMYCICKIQNVQIVQIQY